MSRSSCASPLVSWPASFDASQIVDISGSDDEATQSTSASQQSSWTKKLRESRCTPVKQVVKRCRKRLLSDIDKGDSGSWPWIDDRAVAALEAEDQKAKAQKHEE